MNSETLLETAYTTIRTKILSLEFPAGTLLSIYKLAEQLEMSRTPITHAIARLELEGLVVTFKNRGVMVKEISTNECLDIFEIMHCHRLYTLDLVESSSHHAFPLESLRDSLNELLVYKEQDNYLKYAECALYFMRGLVVASNNQVMLQLFDAHQDKLLLSSITSYTQNPQLQFYSGLDFSKKLFYHIENMEYRQARKLLLKHYAKVKERIIVSGIVKM